MQMSDPNNGTKWDDGSGGGGGGGGGEVVITRWIYEERIPNDEEGTSGLRNPSSPSGPSSQGISPRGLANSADAARRDASGAPPRDRQPRGASPALSDSKLDKSRLAPAPPRPAPAAPGPTPAPDWTTQTEWGFTPPDPRLFQPITSVDTGNRPLNVVLNKVLLPWSNATAFLVNIPLATIVGVDDYLRHSIFSQEYQAAQMMMPLEGAMGLAIEGAPAVQYARAQLSQSWSAFSKNERVLTALLTPVFPTLEAASDAPALAPVTEGAVPPLTGGIVRSVSTEQALAEATAELEAQKAVAEDIILEIEPWRERPASGWSVSEVEGDLKRLSRQSSRAANALRDFRAARGELTDALNNVPVPPGREIFWDPPWARRRPGANAD